MSPMRSGVKSLRVSWTEPIAHVELINYIWEDLMILFEGKGRFALS